MRWSRVSRSAALVTSAASVALGSWLLLAALSVVGLETNGPNIVVSGIDVSASDGYAAVAAAMAFIMLGLISVLGAITWAIALAAYRSPRRLAYLVARRASIVGILLAAMVPIGTVSFLRAYGIATLVIGALAASALWAGSGGRRQRGVTEGSR